MTIWPFVRAVLRRPLQVGAILPSGRALARAMVDEARVGEGQVVAELGAGSGAFTAEIVRRCPRSRIYAFEINESLGEVLSGRFPEVTVITAPVERLAVVAPGVGLTRIDRVVSGLPWALWAEERQAAILDVLLPYLGPGARFVTFHYAHSRTLGRVEVTGRLLRERFSRVSQSSVVWANIPPAFVHIAEGPRWAGSDGVDGRIAGGMGSSR